MLAKGEVRVPLSVLEERRELDLLPEGFPVPDSLSLPPLSVTDAFGNPEDLGNAVIGKEDGSIVVCEDNVAGAHRVLADAGRHERPRVARQHLQRSGRARTQADHWQADRQDVSGVAVQAPHEEPSNTRSSRFGDDKIPDAGLVGASTVVDDEHVAFARLLERFEEHIDAAGVPSGQHSACYPRPRRERTRAGRRASHRDVDADAGVREMRRRQRRQPRRVVRVHALTVPIAHVDTDAPENWSVWKRPVSRLFGVSPFETDFRRKGQQMNRRVSHLFAGWRTGLSLPVLALQAGNALNLFGYGLVLPFEIIYLHQVRGFSTSTAGLVLAATMGTSAIATPPTGALLDRYSAKALVVAGSFASALGYAGFAFVESPWQGFACSVVSGVGLGIAGTANRTLIVRLIRPDQRAAAFALNRVAGNFGIGAGATVGGFIVAAAQRLSTFQLLYFFDAVTYAAFALIVLAAVPSPRAEIATTAQGNGTGFRAVARDRPFLIVIAANVVLVVAGHTFFSNILPPFAKAHTPVGPAAIGIIILVNTFVIVIAQIPAVRLVARMRRTHAFAVTGVLFAVALLGVLPATLVHSELAATSVLIGVAIVLAVGEIAHILVLGPLVADMAPAHLLGRYLSLYTLTFSGSLALGPAIGGYFLQASPDAIWWGGALATLLAGAVLLQLGDRIPDPLHQATAPPTLAPAPEPEPA